MPNHQDWEPVLVEAGHMHALFDGLNRFYVRRDDQDLLPVVGVPANIFDNYTPHRFVREADTAPPAAPIAKEEHVRDYDFDQLGMTPGRLGGPVGQARRVLRRLQRPWFDRQIEILYELRAALDADAVRIATAEAHLAELRRQVLELRVQVEAEEARSWDQTAIARRLAALEDATPGLAPTPPPVT